MGAASSIAGSVGSSGGGGMGSSNWAAMGAQSAVNTIGAIGTYMITGKQNSILKSQARLAEMNAQLADMKADYSLISGERQITSMTQGAGEHREQQRARLAHSGFAIGEGSSAESLASTDIVKTIQSNQISSSAHAQAWGHRWEALNSRNQAAMIKAQQKSPFMTAASQFLLSEGQNLLQTSLKMDSLNSNKTGTGQQTWMDRYRSNNYDSFINSQGLTFRDNYGEMGF